MENGRKFTWQVRLAAVIIFLLGFAAGALTSNIYNVWFADERKLTKEEKYERIFNKLQLTEEQRTEVRKIINETREEIQALRRENEPKMREIRERTSEKLRKVMTQEQWEQFQQLREEAFSNRNSK